MELLIVAIVLGIPGLALAGLVAALVALRRVGALQRRILELEERLAAPGPPVRDRSGEPITEPIEIPPGPTPAAPTPSAPVPEQRPSGPPATPVASTPVQAPPPSTTTPGMPSTGATPPDREIPAGPPPPGHPRPPRGVEWERWLGVRGAAVAGGLVLALAAILLFKYTIDHGLITPTLRVALGLLGGSGALLASQWLHARGQRWGADGLAGGGIVALYASLWAAHTLYGMLPFVAAGLLMILVTLVCGLLALKRPSILVAALGLAGGFATPLLLSAAADRPLPLFGYLLLLDAGILWLARTRRWPLLAFAALAATTLWQVLWMLRHLHEPAAVLVTLAVLGTFAVAFTAAGGRKGVGPWRVTTPAAVLLPSGLAAILVLRSGLAVTPFPLFALLALLAAAAVWVASAPGSEWLGPAGGGAALGVASAWLAVTPAPVTGSWQAAVAMAMLALVVHAAASLLRAVRTSPASLAAPLVSGGLLAATITGCAPVSTTPWPLLALWVALGTLLTVHALRHHRPWLLPAGLAGPAAGFLVWAAGRGAGPEGPSGTAALAAVVGLALLPRGAALVLRKAPTTSWMGRSAAGAALVGLLTPVALTAGHVTHPLPAAATAALVGLLAASAAVRPSSGWLFLAATATTALVQTVLALLWLPRLDPGGHTSGMLAILAATASLFLVWPVLARPAYARSRVAWAAGALAGPLWFPALHGLWTGLWGRAGIGALPILLALATLAAFLASRRTLAGTAVRNAAASWYLGVVLCLVGVAIPLQLEKSWITIGWALNGLALLALWRRIPSSGLKWFGLGLLGLALVRLVANPSVLGYWPRGPIPILNWIAYTYWIPILAFLGSWRILAPREGDRLAPWERRLAGGRPPGVVLTGLAAVATIFAWLNLAVVDLFATGEYLSLPTERLAARDLTLSLTWAVYAVLLLALGMWRDSGGLRWLSLGLLVLTLGKVFLHDLGNLTDLYRVGSLLGLALSLILVSLAYQRFVLRREPTEEP